MGIKTSRSVFVIAGIADTDIQKHAVAVKAFPLPEIDVVFGDDQKIFMVTFKIFRDPATGVLWTFGQDAAA